MSHSRPGQLRGYGPRHTSFDANSRLRFEDALKRVRLLVGIYISLGFFYFQRFLIARNAQREHLLSLRSEQFTSNYARIDWTGFSSNLYSFYNI